jgi:predicted XRE-type DNA-binding protein
MTQTLSQGIMQILESRGLNLRRMAQVVGVHPSELSRIKKGMREWTTDQLVAIAEYMGQPLGVILLAAMREIEDRSRWSECMSKLVDALIAEFQRSEQAMAA